MEVSRGRQSIQEGLTCRKGPDHSIQLFLQKLMLVKCVYFTLHTEEDVIEEWEEEKENRDLTADRWLSYGNCSDFNSYGSNCRPQPNKRQYDYS